MILSLYRQALFRANKTITLGLSVKQQQALQGLAITAQAKSKLQRDNNMQCAAVWMILKTKKYENNDNNNGNNYWLLIFGKAVVSIWCDWQTIEI